MFLGQVSIGNTWSKLEDLIKSQVSGQSSFSFDATKKYSIQCKSPNSFFIDEFTVNPAESSTATAGIGSSTGITAASVVKATFESLIATAGTYDFIFADSIATAGIGTSTGITSASVVKATFEEQITETSENTFIYAASSASADIGESTGITEATVNKSTFETQITTTGDYVFIFDGSDWKLGETVIALADYGIDITGTPAENDTITISYVADKWTLSDVEVDLTDYGITYEGTPADADTIIISYTQSDWKLDDDIINLTDYGITYEGTPDDEDTISVVYAEAVIGDMGNQIKEDDIIEYIVDTTNNPVLCVKAKNNVSFVNIDVLEAE